VKQALACVGDKVESAVLIGEGFMPDGLEQKVAAAHQALHLIFLLQDESKLLLHVYTPIYCAAHYNNWLPACIHTTLLCSPVQHLASHQIDAKRCSLFVSFLHTSFWLPANQTQASLRTRPGSVH